MSAYYNEFDPKAAAWLRELIKQNLIAPGEVDERSITEVRPSDLKGFTQCHFFAGIGGWSYALRLARWPDDRPVWTGSCPCQPFSGAGKREGTDDERHLWPAFRWLIAQEQPSAIFGEQVASDDGRDWLSGVRSDLEAMGHETGGSDLCSACVFSPGIRQRLYWVAHPYNQGERRNYVDQKKATRQAPIRGEKGLQPISVSCRDWSSVSMVNTVRGPDKNKTLSFYGPSDKGPWSEFDIVSGIDKRFRRIEPGSFPMAYGVSERVGLLRGYGNAINPWVAKTFIRATMT